MHVARSRFRHFYTRCPLAPGISHRDSRFADSILRLVTVKKAMLNNDLRCRAPANTRYSYALLCQSQSPFYRKTAPVVVRNNYCSGRRARLRARLQGMFYARLVNSRGTRRAESRHRNSFSRRRWIAPRGVKLFLLFTIEQSARETLALARGFSGYIKSDLVTIP